MPIDRERDRERVDGSADRTEPVTVSMSVNGHAATVRVPAGALLVDVLRDELGLKGAKRSCDVQMCGACTVLVDGCPVSSCCYLAVDVAGRDVLTVEGLADSDSGEQGIYQLLEDAFVALAAVQCGFCTPGLLVTLTSLIRDAQLHGASTRADVRHALHGNICRCTGYEPILHAVMAALAALTSGEVAAAEAGGQSS